MQENKRP